MAWLRHEDKRHEDPGRAGDRVQGSGVRHLG